MQSNVVANKRWPNPTRQHLIERLETLIAEYITDTVDAKQYFAMLTAFVDDMSREEPRALRKELPDIQLTIFDWQFFGTVIGLFHRKLVRPEIWLGIFNLKSGKGHGWHQSWGYKMYLQQKYPVTYPILNDGLAWT